MATVDPPGIVSQALPAAWCYDAGIPMGGEGEGMGLLAEDEPSTLAANIRPELILLDRIERQARGIAHPWGLSCGAVRAQLIRRCEFFGLQVSTRESVASRGTGDAYRGRVSVVVHWPDPAANPEAPATPPPPAKPGQGTYVAVEFGQTAVKAKSRHKLQQLPQHLPIASLVILIRAAAHPAIPGIDSVLCLGA